MRRKCACSLETLALELIASRCAKCFLWLAACGSVNSAACRWKDFHRLAKSARGMLKEEKPADGKAKRPLEKWQLFAGHQLRFAACCLNMVRASTFAGSCCEGSSSLALRARKRVWRGRKRSEALLASTKELLIGGLHGGRCWGHKCACESVLC